MINLSRRTLTPHQVRLLMRGPKFCPVETGKNTDFYGGVKTFSKKLALQEKYFDVSFSDPSLIRQPSKKHVTTKNKDLLDIISTINKITPTNKRTPDNLDGEERTALEEILNLCKASLVVKKADKSNTLVVMEKDDYEGKLVMNGHLCTTTYEKAPDDANKKVYKKLEKLCKKHERCITKNEQKVILKEDWSESQFYVLPKIHKCQSILDQISHDCQDYMHVSFPNDLKGRPINGDVNSVTQGLSKLLDKILKPLVTHSKTYIKDEFDFLRKFPRKVPPDTRIVCFDVTSLYTSIPTDLGIEALDYWYDRLSSLIDKRFTKSFILESVRFILENNFFQFNSVMWHQCCGTAMGKSFAPPYACLTMSYLEETVLIPKLLPRHFDDDTCKLLIEIFLRYIDDNIIGLPLSITIETFLGLLNSMNPSIQYTASAPIPRHIDRINFNCTNFLAIKVLQDPQGWIKFDVYYKETNAHDYLAFNSHHPEHTRTNIPYVLAKRIIVITSEDTWVERNLKDLRRFLLERDYPVDVIERGIHNALLQGPAPPTSNTKVVPLIAPYLGNLDSANIVSTTRDLIASSSNERLNNAFKDAKLVQCYTQPPNLLRILSSSRFNSNEPETRNEKGIYHCKHNGCEICSLNYLQQCREFITSNGTVWNVKCHITCNSLNVIYFLKCIYCLQETKLGKTDDLRLRTNNHRSGCRNGRSSDKFDNHVYACSRARQVPPSEPFFLMYVMMSCNNYDKLLNIERCLHLKGHDTTFQLL